MEIVKHTNIDFLGKARWFILASLAVIAAFSLTALVLAVIGAVCWMLIRHRRIAGASAAASWTDAACPACLVLGALGLDQSAVR